MCDSDKWKVSECEWDNMITRVRTQVQGWVHKGKSENMRARARVWEREWEHECNVLITRCQRGEKKYEVKRQDLRLQWDSDMRGEVLLVFWYVQGSIYIMWNFKMKSWQPINCTACAKDRGLAWKSNLQNYHIWIITPVWLLHDPSQYLWITGLMLSQSGMLTWPHYFDILTFWYPWELFTEP
jgi:hypothetical protein